MVSAQVRREAAWYAVSRRISQRRACALLQVSRSSLRYELRMPPKNAPVIEAMRVLSGIYPRFGARRIRVLLSRDGIELGKERCARLWAQAALQVPKKRRRRRVANNRPRIPTPMVRRTVASYEFLFDVCANGQPLKCLTVLDEYTRECLASMWRVRSARIG